MSGHDAGCDGSGDPLAGLHDQRIGDPMRGDPRMCKCSEQQMYVWRDDPEWWRCADCDGRVRLLDEAERRARDDERKARGV